MTIPYWIQGGRDRISSASRNMSTICRARLPLPCAIWWRQEKPLAITVASAGAGSSTKLSGFKADEQKTGHFRAWPRAPAARQDIRNVQAPAAKWRAGQVWEGATPDF